MKIIDQRDGNYDRLWSALMRSHDNPSALIGESNFEYRALYLGSALERHVSAIVVEGEQPIAGSSFELVHDSFGRRSLEATATPSATITAKGISDSLRAGAEALLRKW